MIKFHLQFFIKTGECGTCLNYHPSNLGAVPRLTLHLTAVTKSTRHFYFIAKLLVLIKRLSLAE